MKESIPRKIDLQFVPGNILSKQILIQKGIKSYKIQVLTPISKKLGFLRKYLHSKWTSLNPDQQSKISFLVHGKRLTNKWLDDNSNMKIRDFLKSFDDTIQRDILKHHQMKFQYEWREDMGTEEEISPVFLNKEVNDKMHLHVTSTSRPVGKKSQTCPQNGHDDESPSQRCRNESIVVVGDEDNIPPMTSSLASLQPPKSKNNQTLKTKSEYISGENEKKAIASQEFSEPLSSLPQLEGGFFNSQLSLLELSKDSSTFSGLSMLQSHNTPQSCLANPFSSVSAHISLSSGEDISDLDPNVSISRFLEDSNPLESGERKPSTDTQGKGIFSEIAKVQTRRNRKRGRKSTTPLLHTKFVNLRKNQPMDCDNDILEKRMHDQFGESESMVIGEETCKDLMSVLNQSQQTASSLNCYNSIFASANDLMISSETEMEKQLFNRGVFSGSKRFNLSHKNNRSNNAGSAFGTTRCSKSIAGKHKEKKSSVTADVVPQYANRVSTASDFMPFGQSLSRTQSNTVTDCSSSESECEVIPKKDGDQYPAQKKVEENTKTFTQLKKKKRIKPTLLTTQIGY